jgi:hypothetical protein
MLFVIALPVLALAGEKKNEPIARVATSVSSVEWQLGAAAERVTLTVTGPDGFEFTKSFAAGKAPSFRLQDINIDSPDGSYTWELRATPHISKEIRAQLAAAREADDSAAIARITREAGLNNTPVQSGGLMVMNGAFVPVDREEPRGATQPSASATSSTGVTASATHGAPITAMDTVIADDLIVQSSECVGFDCVDGESFGTDTIRLKENTTRIAFVDTSSGAGFPSTDWTLEANDQASGGQNRFSIVDVTDATTPFTIRGLAPTNSIFVASNGKVGFRTASPLLDLHVTTGDTPALRFEQTNTSGFTAQTWDVAGNEANFFVRDLTGGSRLPFRIRPGAPTSSVDIAASGNVGIGTASPEVKLHVFSASTSDTFIGLGEDPDGSTGTQSAFNVGYGGSSFGRAAGFFNVRPDSNAVAPNPSVRFMTANTVRMIIDNEGFVGLGSTTNPDAPIHYTNGTSQARLTTAGVWQDASSRKAKENIKELDASAAMKALEELKPVTYNYKVLPTDGKVGFIAEDVPDLVATPEREGLSALDIVAVVTKVVQEQQKTIDHLNERINELEKSQNK